MKPVKTIMQITVQNTLLFKILGSISLLCSLRLVIWSTIQ